MLSTMLEKKSC